MFTCLIQLLITKPQQLIVFRWCHTPADYTQCRRCPGDREFFILDWCEDLWWCRLLSLMSLSLLGWSLYWANASNLCWVDTCCLSLGRLLSADSRSLRSLRSSLSASVESLLLVFWLKNWLNFVGSPTSSSDEESITNDNILSTILCYQLDISNNDYAYCMCLCMLSL